MVEETCTLEAETEEPTSLSASKRVAVILGAGLLTLGSTLLAPSQDRGLSGSCQQLPDHSDGFVPDSHRLPFSAAARGHLEAQTFTR